MSHSNYLLSIPWSSVGEDELINHCYYSHTPLHEKHMERIVNRYFEHEMLHHESQQIIEELEFVQSEL